MNCDVLHKLSEFVKMYSTGKEVSFFLDFILTFWK